MSETLIGEVERVTFESEETGFRVIKLTALEGRPGAERVAAVGNFPPVGPGARVRVTGRFVQDARHGEQFRVQSLVELAPDTLKGLEKYLASGVLPGVGPGFARRIVEEFGMDSLRVLDTKPERLKEVRGLGKSRIEGIIKGWREQREMSNLMLLLQTHGASPKLAVSIIKRYGDKAAQVVQRSPYRLALEVRGVGFKTADRLARSLGISGDHPERAQAGVIHVLREFSDQGHSLTEKGALVQRAAEMLGVGQEHVDVALDALWGAERVQIEGTMVYLPRLYRAEVQAAEGIARLQSAPGNVLTGIDAALDDFERRRGFRLAKSQREAVARCAEHKLVVVTGGPGVGKTTLIQAIVSVVARAKLRIRLAAPTGRAAKRLSEATERDACTLHRLLEFEPHSGAFQRHGEQPIEADCVIVDEASMVDLNLAAALLDAMPTHARLIIVGDVDQLPSVGSGAVLRDLIDSNTVETVKLNQIFRQAEQSGIVVNAHRILGGEEPQGAEDPNADFFVIPRNDPSKAAELVRHLVVERIPKRFGLDPKTDIQVLTPMHRGLAGTENLNTLLQEALNPNGRAQTSRGRLRVGDKVMQTKNDYEREVFNGDVGIVSGIEEDENALVVDFDGRSVRYEDAATEALTLAYAVSIHKSQGSEYPAIVVPFLTSHFVMLSRNLLYTAVTRARRLCVLVSDRKALSLALGETRREQRTTHLAERLREAVARSSN